LRRKREIVFLLLLATTTVGLKAGELYYQNMSYRFLATAPTPLIVPSPTPPSTETVITLPNGLNSTNISVSDNYVIADSLSPPLYYNAANAARAEELATISLTLDAIHATQLLIQLLSISMVLRLRNSKPRMPPIFF